MTSTFMGIEIGKRAINAHQQALNITGHNLSNASTEGYSRQRVELAASDPIYLPGLTREETPGQIGQGVAVERVERLRDQLLDRRIVAQAGGEGYWSARDPYLRELEQIYLEPGTASIRGKMDEFWAAWQELSLRPADNAPRVAVLERGKTLVDGIHERYDALRRLQDQTEEDIRLTVERVNDLTSQIAGLSKDIQRVKSQGDNPNDLMDRRDLLVDRLSSIINIATDDRDPDEFMIHTGGEILVQGGRARELDLVRNPETGYSDIAWKDRNPSWPLGGDNGGAGVAFEFRNGDHDGRLGALVELRDRTIRDEIQSLDAMTMNFVGLVNEIHEKAYGLGGETGTPFFTEQPSVLNVDGAYDRDGDGEFDHAYIFRLTGTNALERGAQIGLEGEITLSSADGTRRVAYHATDTVADVIERINNAGAEVTARLNTDGALTLTATPAGGLGDPDFVIRRVEDTGADGGPGLLLADYAGILTRGEVYDWERPDAVAALRGAGTPDGVRAAVAPVVHPAGWIEVNPALIDRPNAVAAGFGANGRPANAGNGEAALAIAAIRDTPVMVGQDRTFDDFFANAVGRAGILGEQSGRALETQNLIMKQLEEMRQSVSGVNLDEELSNMLKYQHGYAAASRFITTVNSLLDTLINRTGA